MTGGQVARENRPEREGGRPQRRPPDGARSRLRELNRYGPHPGPLAVSKSISSKNIRLKRAYEHPDAGDGTRVLVDRLWPRGVTKKAAAVDLWVKDLAPSTELRKWFGHDRAR